MSANLNSANSCARESSRRSGSPLHFKILEREMLLCEWSGSGKRIGNLSVLSTRRSQKSDVTVCTRRPSRAVAHSRNSILSLQREPVLSLTRSQSSFRSIFFLSQVGGHLPLVISAKMSQGPWSPTSAGPIYFWLQGLGLSRKLGRFFPLQAASHVPMQNNYHRRRLIPEFNPPTRAQ